jgi:hypothetical protein
MAKKKQGEEEEWLIMPEIYSSTNDDQLESALRDKTRELISKGFLTEDNVSFILISGNFHTAKGYTYSAIRDWKGIIRPEDAKKTGRRPVLDSTFACLSVYLSSLVSFQCDFQFAYEEIKKILYDNERPDLWTIIDEKLPFVSLPPNEMFPESLKSPISPYYTIQADNELTLGELYPSVHLSNIVKNLKSRFFTFFTYKGNTAFAYFNVLPKSAKFGFDQQVPDFDQEPTTENLENYIKNASTMKELFIALIHSHNEQKLIQYEIADYESLLNRLLEIQEVDEGEG